MPFQKGNKLALGRIKSKEEIEKLRKIHLGKKTSEQTKLKQRLAKLGKKHTKIHNESIGNSLRGKPKSLEHINNVNKALASIRKIVIPRGDKHKGWKGDFATKGSLHSWLKRQKWKANKCENRENNFLSFKCSRKSKKYHWANKSQCYKRNTDDYMELCVSCHSIYDHNHPNSGYN